MISSLKIDVELLISFQTNLMAKNQLLSENEKEQLISILKKRFEKNMERHQDVRWQQVETRLSTEAEKLWSLEMMEQSGGEPDVIGIDPNSGQVLFFDCAPETPKDRRSLCYDRAALDSRKQFKPANSIIDMAEEMGVQVLNEQDYHTLQSLGSFDQKTSSWLLTPDNVRKLGGAIFGDKRFGRVFIYHNGAESYYAARGFRAKLYV